MGVKNNRFNKHESDSLLLKHLPNMSDQIDVHERIFKILSLNSEENRK